MESYRNLLVAYCAADGRYVDLLSFVNSLYSLSYRSVVQREGSELHALGEGSLIDWNDNPDSQFQSVTEARWQTLVPRSKQTC